MRSLICAPESPTIPAAGESILLQAGVVLAAVGATVLVVSELTNELILATPHHHLDANGELNFWAWAGSAAILAAAVGAFLSAATIAARRALLSVLTVWFVFLSADELIEVHERIGIRFGELADENPSALWLIAYLPAMVASLVVLLQIARDLCSPAARRVMHGGLVLFTIAVAAEIAGAGAHRSGGKDGGLYVATVAVEEAAELAGWLWVGSALAAASFAAVARSARESG